MRRSREKYSGLPACWLRASRRAGIATLTDWRMRPGNGPFRASVGEPVWIEVRVPFQ
jgi:hypothetical protein